MMQAPVVDVHAHLLLPQLHAEVSARAPEQVQAAADLELLRNGQESIAASGAMIGQRIPLLTDVDARLAAMDAQGVDTQWVSVSPNHFYPWAHEELAWWITQEVHSQVAAHVSCAPERLRGLGMIPLQHPTLAVAALEDAMLNHGFLGVEISSFAQHIELSNPALEEFWRRAAQLRAVIFLHPFGCSLDERLDRFYLSNTVGQPVENAVALSHLIFAGVLDRHPELRIVAAHGGGYLPTAIGRSDRAWRVRPEAHGCVHPPSEYLRRLWFDTVVHDHTALQHLVEVVGEDRVLLGSDFPFDMGLDEPVEFIAHSTLTAQAQQKVLRHNVTRLAQDQEVRG